MAIKRLAIADQNAAGIFPVDRIELRSHLVTVFSAALAEASMHEYLSEALEDLEKIERYIIGETE